MASEFKKGFSKTFAPSAQQGAAAETRRRELEAERRRQVLSKEMANKLGAPELAGEDYIFVKEYLAQKRAEASDKTTRDVAAQKYANTQDKDNRDKEKDELDITYKKWRNTLAKQLATGGRPMSPAQKEARLKDLESKTSGKNGAILKSLDEDLFNKHQEEIRTLRIKLGKDKPEPEAAAPAAEPFINPQTGEEIIWNEKTSKWEPVK